MSDQTETPQGGLRLWMIVPALGSLMVLAVLGLRLADDEIQRLPSALIDKPVPEFALEPLDPGKPGIDTAALTGGGVQLLNIWASWCGPCRAEHPHLMALEAEGVTIHGMNYKDAPENARAFLAELGDPYDRIGTDDTGRAGIEFGVYGVPETFVINDAGKIVYKHVGPILQRDIEKVREAIRRAADAG